MTAVELRGVDKSFPAAAGGRLVLDGVDLVVAAGEVVAVAGRSGSGKTTLLTLVAGLEAPDAGSVHLLGRDATTDEASWGDLAILPQSLGLLDELSVLENVSLPARLRPTAGGDPMELLAGLGVDHLADRFPDEISLGEQQRTALARAAVVQPRVLLADEPISHQNSAWAAAMVDLLRTLADGGTTCLLATHNEAAFRVADRVLELRAGHLEPRAL